MKDESPYKTVLFTDIAESVLLYEKLGDTGAQEIIAESFRTLSGTVEKFGGRVVKTIGDEILSTFEGVEAAVQCALEMQAGFGRRVPPLSCRIGLHCGPLVEEKGDVFGKTVNLAARLVAQAKPDQILLTLQILQKLKPGRFQVRLVDKTRLKGIKEVVDLYEILAAEENEDGTTLIAGDALTNASSISTSLKLLYQGREVQVGPEKPALGIGRDSASDLIVEGGGASRRHARIELRRDKFFLIDQSLNGTTVVDEEGNSVLLHREEIVLQGKGKIILGRPAEEEALLLIHYQCQI